MIDTVAAPSISFFGYILPFLVVLTVVVFFHELGHYWVARWNKIKVDAFAIGFGPELIGFNDRNGTRWKLCAIPLGGYVKFFGDADGASTPDFEKAHQMSAEEQEGSFIHKRVGQRAAVVAAGPIANFILAILIFSVSFMTYGRYIADPVVTQVIASSAAEKAGLQVGDLIVEVDGNVIESFGDIPRIVAPNPERQLVFKVKRGDDLLDFTLTPDRKERVDRFGNKTEVGLVGISNAGEGGKGRVVKSGPVEAVGLAFHETWFIIKSTILYLKDVIIGHQSADQLGGPIQIAKVSGEVATLGYSALIGLTALLSVSIGMLNLFPIPMLDGGHLVFYLFEAIRGKPLSEKVQEYGFRIGMSLVLMLMIFATWNDLSKLFSA